MILPLLAGDSWAWSVALRYDSPTEGVLLDDRERWTVRVGKASELTAERKFLGTWVDGTLVPSTDPTPETLKGRIEADGTLSLKGDWSDPAAAKTIRRLLSPDKTLADRVPSYAVVRHAVLTDSKSRVPGGDLPATLRIEVKLEKATLGGREIVAPPK